MNRAIWKGRPTFRLSRLEVIGSDEARFIVYQRCGVEGAWTRSGPMTETETAQFLDRALDAAQEAHDGN